MSVSMSDHVSMSVCACSHLDRDGDGYISVEEVGVLLEELGVDAGVGQEQDPNQSHGPEVGAAQGAAQGAGQRLQEADAGAGQQLLIALANKQQSGVTFAEFLQYNSQVCLFTHSLIHSFVHHMCLCLGSGTNPLVCAAWYHSVSVMTFLLVWLLCS